MSYVGNWILLLSLDEEEAVEQINGRLAELGHKNQSFRLLDERSWGGTKIPEVDVYGLAANYLPEDCVFDAVSKAKWNDAEDCILVHHPQNGGWKFFKVKELLQK